MRRHHTRARLLLCHLANPSSLCTPRLQPCVRTVALADQEQLGGGMLMQFREGVLVRGAAGVRGVPGSQRLVLHQRAASGEQHTD